MVEYVKQPAARPLGIVAALHDELHELLEQVSGRQRHCIGNREFWSGALRGQPVVLVLSRVGKVAAAATTAVLATQFQVRALVMTGVAGAVAPGVRVGDVVIATRLLQHDVDASPLFPRWEVPLTGVARFSSDPGLSEGLADSAAQVLADPVGQLGQAAVREFGLLAPRVHTGLIVSGDRFVATGQECRALQQLLPDALAVDMEGAAVAQVCHEWRVPCAVIRAISDQADECAKVDFSRFVASVGARYSAAIVRHWLDMAKTPS
ncbi:5'-methylthioadenosine/adenosylhomocysteine nucleosidase [Castellaniella caeni]